MLEHDSEVRIGEWRERMQWQSCVPHLAKKA